MSNKEINVEVYDVETFEEGDGIVLKWGGNIGWGEYTLYYNPNTDKWMGDSEYMDKNDDKKFLRKLLDSFIDQVEIIS
jgi:hypothetical protein